MAQGYPSLLRARKAFAAGYYGIRGRNPYSHPKLRELWERGRQKALERVLAGLGRPTPPKPLAKPKPQAPARPVRRLGMGRPRPNR